MAIPAALPFMAAIAGASEIGSGIMRIGAANEQENALAQQQKEIQINTQQKLLSNYDAAEKLLQRQEVAQSTTGTSPSSPSFNAIQRNTVNKSAQGISNTEISGNIAEENNRIEQENVKNTLYAQLFGSATDFTQRAMNVIPDLPSGSL